MTDEKLTPERAVRLLRAKGAELEAQVIRNTENGRPLDDLSAVAADTALIAQLLADHIERTESPPLPLATQQRLQGGVISRLADMAEDDDEPVVGNWGVSESACGPECKEFHTFVAPCILAHPDVDDRSEAP